jgi:hypothetical protein
MVGHRRTLRRTHLTFLYRSRRPHATHPPAQASILQPCFTGSNVRWRRLSGTPPATCPRERQAPSRRTLLSTSHQVGTATSWTSLACSPLTTEQSSPTRTTRTAGLTVYASTRPSRSPEGRERSPARPGAAASSVQYLRIAHTTRSFCRDYLFLDAAGCAPSSRSATWLGVAASPRLSGSRPVSAAA